MNQHFDKHLNVQEFIKDRKPSKIIELGGDTGLNTRKLASVCNVITISDNPMPSDLTPFVEEGKLQWIQGLSQTELKNFPDTSLEFVIVDTDHNYTTLKLELDELNRAMQVGGLVILHDVESFRGRNYNKKFYGSGDPYDSSLMSQGRGYTEALEEEVDAGHWRVIKWVKESHGAAAMEKT